MATRHDRIGIVAVLAGLLCLASVTWARPAAADDRQPARVSFIDGNLLVHGPELMCPSTLDLRY